MVRKMVMALGFIVRRRISSSGVEKCLLLIEMLRKEPLFVFLFRLPIVISYLSCSLVCR